MLAKDVNDNASILNERGAFTLFASKLAPTGTKKPRSRMRSGAFYCAPITLRSWQPLFQQPP
ncbi:hypothetical protein GDV60_22150 [Pseudomonas sp. DTU12.1]|nr:hypothetical protein GDV60_22150 [Pseudomonas sp. DTU12.1]